MSLPRDRQDSPALASHVPASDGVVHVSPQWFIELPQCPSTNTWAKEQLEVLSHGDVVFTPRQTAGRGQHGRRWLSPPGVLTFSIVVDLPPSPESGKMALVAGLGVSLAAEDALGGGQKVWLKWPNDCYLRNRKLAGILCEGQATKQGMRIVIGIGMNLSVDWDDPNIISPPDLRQPPISLGAVMASAPDSRTMIAMVRTYILQGAGMLTDGRWSALLPTIRQRDWLDGRHILAEREGLSPLAGQAGGITDEGHLTLHLADGGTTTIQRGHIREASP